MTMTMTVTDSFKYYGKLFVGMISYLHLPSNYVYIPPVTNEKVETPFLLVFVFLCCFAF